MNKRSKVTITIPFVTLDELCKEHHKKDFSTKLSESKYNGNISLFKRWFFWGNNSLVTEGISYGCLGQVTFGKSTHQ
jgi:hypothetical protein